MQVAKKVKRLYIKVFIVLTQVYDGKKWISEMK